MEANIYIWCLNSWSLVHIQGAHGMFMAACCAAGLNKPPVLAAQLCIRTAVRRLRAGYMRSYAILSSLHVTIIWKDSLMPACFVLS
jgi:hypothetical protein